jgi:uncharacterized coiled-coil protein SlyX
MGTPVMTERTAYRSARAQTQNSAVIWLVPIIALIAMVATGLAVYSLTRVPATKTLQAQVGVLQAQVTSLRAQLRSVHPKLAALQRAERSARARIASLSARQGTSASAGDVTRLSATVQALQACIPQLQTELARLNVKTTNLNGWLIGAVLTRPISLSPGCAHTLRGRFPAR